MDIQQLLGSLRERGIKLWVEGEDLCFDAPKGAFTGELKLRLKRNKPAVIEHLRKIQAVDQEEDLPLAPVPRPPLPAELMAERPDLAARAAERTLSLMPQSFSQQRLWFLDQLEEQANYNINEALNLVGAFDMKAVERTLDDLFRRHEVLRSTFDIWQGEPIQIIDSKRNTDPTMIDLRGLEPDHRSQVLRLLMSLEQHYRFNLEKGPVFRITVLVISDMTRCVLLSMHHVIGDGWSVGILTRELVALYLSHLLGRPPGLPPVRLQYADYCYWLQHKLKREMDTLLAYWTRQLEGIPDLLQLPTDYLRTAMQRNKGGVVMFALGPEKTEALREIGRGINATSFMVVLSLFKVLLGRYSGQSDISVGFPIANRGDTALEGLIGLFANTLVLRNRFEDNPTFIELVRRVRTSTLDAFQHQEMPFERLVEELKPARNLSHAPLFQVMITYHNTPPSKVDQVMDRMPTNQIMVQPINRQEITSRYDMELTISEMDGGLSFSLQFDAELFKRSTVFGMGVCLTNLIKSVIETPHARVEKLNMISEEMRNEMLVTWNRTERELEGPLLVHQRIEEQARLRPGATALTDDAGDISFADLVEAAKRLTAQLTRRGVQPEDVIPLAMTRGRDFLTAMLGVFGAGCAYLPLDPTHPPQRWATVLSQTRSPFLLADAAYQAAVEETLPLLEEPIRPVALRCDHLITAETPELPACGELDGDRLAYVIFTSGSTGIPKGAMVTHRGMINHLDAKWVDLKLDHTDTVVQNAVQSFDISVWQFLLAPMVGGRTLVANDNVMRDPAALIELVDRHQATILEVVPSLLEPALRELESGPAPTLERLRFLIPTGEALPPELCRRWLALYPDIPLVNAYGPTECSDDVTHYFIETPPPETTVHSPIGKPIINTQLYVLDRFFQLQPPGVPGELYVGGAGVGRGYLNRPERTASTFVPDPFTPETMGLQGQRLYKTGDKVIADRDGTMVYLGRLDFQVKLRGFRIELGEVEQVLLRSPLVSMAAVIVHGDQPALRRMIAYIIAREGNQINTIALSQWLREQLPDYMVPAHLVVVPKFPTTPSGKIDRQALAEMTPTEAAATVETDTTPPRDHHELQMTAIWERLLGVHPIGIHADFFDLGGHSILAIHLMSEIKTVFGRKLSLASLFQNPTVERLARLLHDETGDAEDILVTLQSEGKAEPLYVTHPIGGNVLCYRDLAYHLGADRPVYGIQATALEAGKGLDNLEAMARHYVQRVRAQQPRGPYFLLGWSFGGSIAFEMARVLVEAGQEIGGLMLLDTPIPLTGPPDEDMLPGLLLRELHIHYGPHIPITVEILKQYEGEEQVAFVMDLARRAGIVTEELDEERIRRLLWVYRNNFKSLVEYRPKPVEVPIQFFQPEGTTFHNAPEVWGRLCGGNLTVRRVGGTHHDMVEGDQAGPLARAIHACFDSADGSRSC
ncbi:MAG: amino acid adenylation domain-containing protein [Acidobacteriota bacterium]|nr:amino acid adenylation domain-containing protein [Acidobacteriota bacterium]